MGRFSSARPERGNHFKNFITSPRAHWGNTCGWKASGEYENSTENIYRELSF